MKREEQGRDHRRSGARVAAIGLVGLAALMLAAQGCGGETGGTGERCTTSVILEPLAQSAVDKIDLVLMIDNSRSMADKQQILADAVPDLVRGLVLPKCLDMNGVPAAMQPTDPLQMCPAGTKYEFPPVLNIHIGVISSSIGGHGSDACQVM